MPDQTEKNESLVDDEEVEDSKDVPEKKKNIAGNLQLFKILMYVLLFVGIILLSALSSLVVFEYKMYRGDVPKYSALMKMSGVPQDVYMLPEFKLVLDQKKDDDFSTILQLKLGLAYKKGDQLVLNELIQRKEQILDRIQYIISKRTYDEISSAENREVFLKEELLYALNNLMESGILEIYYDTFFISRVRSN